MCIRVLACEVYHYSLHQCSVGKLYVIWTELNYGEDSTHSIHYKFEYECAVVVKVLTVPRHGTLWVGWSSIEQI